MTRRTARCQCGQLSLTIEGEPRFTTACCCSRCQRRTGSSYSHIGRWPRTALVAQSGEGRVFERTGESGGLARQTFCPTCGSTVLTEVSLMPDLIGVPVGCFGDPALPAPAIAVWCENRPAWVVFPEGVPQLDQQTGAASDRS
ncbi:MAG: GFA family protein [Caulobacter sp.]|nr:GFA family protein [Caulobacter sp.]